MQLVNIPCVAPQEVRQRNGQLQDLRREHRQLLKDWGPVGQDVEKQSRWGMFVQKNGIFGDLGINNGDSNGFNGYGI